MKAAFAVIVLLTLAGCATTPMNKDVLLAHAERNCRVEASVSKAYPIDSTGVGTRSVAYRACMASHGYR